MKMFTRTGMRRKPWCWPGEPIHHSQRALLLSHREPTTNVWVSLRVAAEKNKFSVPGTWRSVNYYPTSSPIAQALEKRGRGFWLCCEKEARGSDGTLANARERWGALAALRRILLSTSSRCFYRLELLLLEKLEPKFPGQPDTFWDIVTFLGSSWIYCFILKYPGGWENVFYI